MCFWLLFLCLTGSCIQFVMRIHLSCEAIPHETFHKLLDKNKQTQKPHKNPQQIKTKRKSVTSNGVIGQKREHTVRLRAYRKLSVWLMSWGERFLSLSCSNSQWALNESSLEKRCTFTRNWYHPKIFFFCILSFIIKAALCIPTFRLLHFYWRYWDYSKNLDCGYFSEILDFTPEPWVYGKNYLPVTFAASRDLQLMGMQLAGCKAVKSAFSQQLTNYCSISSCCCFVCGL